MQSKLHIARLGTQHCESKHALPLFYAIRQSAHHCESELVLCDPTCTTRMHRASLTWANAAGVKPWLKTCDVTRKHGLTKSSRSQFPNTTVSDLIFLCQLKLDLHIKESFFIIFVTNIVVVVAVTVEEEILYCLTRRERFFGNPKKWTVPPVSATASYISLFF